MNRKDRSANPNRPFSAISQNELQGYLQDLFDEVEVPSDDVPRSDEPKRSHSDPAAAAPVSRPARVENRTPGGPRKGLPEWARQPFQGLTFEVGGLTLAIPLSKLSGVDRLPKGFGCQNLEPAWLMGEFQHRGQNVRVVNTENWLIPPKHRAAGKDTGAEATYVILVGDGQWGIACDEPGKVISIAPIDINWRSTISQRGWLLGTVPKHVCVLLDIDLFVALLTHKASQG